MADALPARDVQAQRQFDDDELARHRSELERLLAAGELDGTPTLRLMVTVLCRELALGTARGEPVDAAELMRLDKLELRLLHRQHYEQLRELTREGAARTAEPATRRPEARASDVR